MSHIAAWMPAEKATMGHRLSNDSPPDTSAEAAGIRHTALASKPRYGVNTMMGIMAGSSAGVKRNRRPRGVELVRSEVRLQMDTERAFTAAARASGNLSVSLYLERLRARYEAEFGSLPVFDDSMEAAHTAA